MAAHGWHSDVRKRNTTRRSEKKRTICGARKPKKKSESAVRSK
jgi:hypothetical protein